MFIHLKGIKPYLYANATLFLKSCYASNVQCK